LSTNASTASESYD